MKIIKKPWGQEELIEHNDLYVVKRLTMNKGCRCSLQYHEQKKETVYVLSGTLNLYLGDTEDDIQLFVMKPGESKTIEPGQIHRMEGSELEDSIYLEASTSELDDVVRLKDDYKRV